MNKKILAVSVAAALSVGASVAHAQSTADSGAVLIVPYYTVQNGNATLINIVNTDTVGKALKVRFRGAEHSDDVFDFQLFMSPGDMWTANISQNAAGLASLSTSDNSCTLPANVNQAFVTSRLAGTPAEKAAGTREGYVEIINMGDIISTGVTSGTSQAKYQQDLYTATKHVNGVAPCTASVLQSIVNPLVQNANSVSGLESATGTGRLSSVATGGLFSNVTIINVNEASAWGFDAVSVDSFGTLVSRYWSQTASAYTGGAAVNLVTLDGVFLSGAVVPAQYDFPDLSTPRDLGVALLPYAQYQAVNAVIPSGALSNEFITADSIFAATDWVVAMPTRRYAIEGRIAAVGADTVDLAAGGLITSTVEARNGEYAFLQPFASVYSAATNCVRVSQFSIYDREETTTTTGVVISPGEVTELALCGEVGVVSFNNAGATTTAALGAELTVNDATIPFVDGWATIGFGADLPVIGNAFIKANNGGTGAANMNFGAAWKHR